MKRSLVKTISLSSMVLLLITLPEVLKAVLGTVVERLEHKNKFSLEDFANQLTAALAA